MSVLDHFLTEISRFLRAKDAAGLRSYLKVEPPLPQIYTQLSQELKAAYRDGSQLDQHISKVVPEDEDAKPDDGNSWPAFQAFLKEYLEFWRDVNFEDLLATHAQLNSLVGTCIYAMSNGPLGLCILSTTLQLCEALSKLAMTLDKRPDLTRSVRGGTQGERKTLVERTSETIQRAFTTCLADRGQSRNGVGRDGKPEGKKIGIYSFANLVLKLLVQCRKTRLASQIFTNVTQHSPPLPLYPASQRVTYLYYLGRFMFSNNHFYWSQLALQSAYDQCRARCISQRRLIVTYLIAANTILGKFPSTTLLSRPEASGLAEKFVPIFEAIRRGDLVSFKRALGPEGGNERWFFQKGLLLPLQSRCEVLVWRSLARRVFLLTYSTPTDANSRTAPSLDINYLVEAARYCQKILEGWQRPGDPSTMQSIRQHTNTIFLQTSLPELQPPARPLKLMANRGIVFGNREPKIADVEALVASLVQQGFLRGFVSHKHQRFAILGAKQRGGALKAGFPEPWTIIQEAAQTGGHDSPTAVPGWVSEERAISGLGGVVNLSGIARPVGSGT